MKEKRKIMLERFVKQTTFESQEDFIKNFKVIVPENFNFGYDVVDVWADEEPNRKALCWTNDKGDHVDFTFAEIKKYSDQTNGQNNINSGFVIQNGVKILIKRRRFEDYLEEMTAL